jgi:hypothetical protein
MNCDASPPPERSGVPHPAAWPLTVIRDTPIARVVTYVYDCGSRRSADSFTCEHNQQKRLFIVTGADGKTEYFRDNPATYLMVEPDPETGDMQPVTKYGRPMVIHLCRQERET